MKFCIRIQGLIDDAKYGKDIFPIESDPNPATNYQIRVICGNCGEEYPDIDFTSYDSDLVRFHCHNCGKLVKNE